MVKVGFLVNPIAGMGGRVGLKGTDGEAYKKALALGAQPVAPYRAKRFLREYKRLGLEKHVELYVAPHPMGSSIVEEEGIPYVLTGELKSHETTPEDTKNISRTMVNRGVNLIVFVGGDGTARDIIEAIDKKTPILGVPSGVKMYSPLFAITPEAAARILEHYVKGDYSIEEVEVLDIDEEAFRKDQLKITLYGTALTIKVSELLQSGKEPTPNTMSIRGNQEAIARYVIENMEPDTLYILGPGTTVKAIADLLGVEKTVLGVDAIYNGRLVGKDLNEKQLLELIEKYKRTKIILTPIGGQGFLLGRGNQQISPKILEKIGKNNIIVVATRDKMSKIRKLRIDTGDPRIDEKLRSYIRVIVDYNEEVVLKIE